MCVESLSSCLLFVQLLTFQSSLVCRRPQTRLCGCARIRPVWQPAAPCDPPLLWPGTSLHPSPWETWEPGLYCPVSSEITNTLYSPTVQHRLIYSVYQVYLIMRTMQIYNRQSLTGKCSRYCWMLCYVIQLNTSDKSVWFIINVSWCSIVIHQCITVSYLTGRPKSQRYILSFVITLQYETRINNRCLNYPVLCLSRAAFLSNLMIIQLITALTELKH